MTTNEDLGQALVALVAERAGAAGRAGAFLVGVAGGVAVGKTWRGPSLLGRRRRIACRRLTELLSRPRPQGFALGRGEAPT